MPKHAFKFPRPVVDAVKSYVERVVQSIDPQQFSQEHHYTTALITLLRGTAYEGEHGLVRFDATPIADRGPGAAESRWGADFAITATVSDRENLVQKVILVQAKLGKVLQMSTGALDDLKDQIRKMRKVVSAPKVMEILTNDRLRDPRMISGNHILNDQPFRSFKLADYVVARITTTLDGATDSGIVAAVKSSRLEQLDLLAKLA